MQHTRAGLQQHVEMIGGAECRRRRDVGVERVGARAAIDASEDLRAILHAERVVAVAEREGARARVEDADDVEQVIAAVFARRQVFASIFVMLVAPPPVLPITPVN